MILLSLRSQPNRDYHLKAEGQLPPSLFISTTRPYQAVTPSTITRWLLATMEEAGIDTATYRAHSTRSAGASDQLRKGLPLTQILKRGHWSETSQTFRLFYNRAWATLIPRHICAVCTCCLYFGIKCLNLYTCRLSLYKFCWSAGNYRLYTHISS